MLAAITRQPGLALTQEEADKLGTAASRVVELYDVPMLDERSRAWIGLGLVGMEVYGSRIATIVIEAKRRPRPVTPIRPTPPSSAPRGETIPPISPLVDVFAQQQAAASTAAQVMNG